MTSTMPTNFKRYAKYSTLTSSELAESFQVSYVTINNWLRECKLPIRPRSNSVDKGWVRQLLVEGKSLSEVEGIVKCSRTTVKNVKRGMRDAKI